MPEDLRIELLADHRHLVDTVAGWHYREWGHEGATDSQLVWFANLARRLKDEVPFTLVALVGQEPAGSISVCWDDADADFADDGPWLSGTYVHPAARNLGVGRALVADAERRAAAEGHTELWAHTREAEQFYARCGWELVRPKVPMQRDAVVRQALQPAAPVEAEP